MASDSERTFGARILNAQNLLAHVSALADYAPPLASERVKDFGQLLDDIDACNSRESELFQVYSAAVSARKGGFYGSGTSLFKIFPLLRGAVIAEYGSKSAELASIDAILRRIRKHTAIRVPASGDGQVPAKVVSQSQQSFGSLTQAFYDIISTLTQLSGYAPSNPALQIPQLQAMAARLDGLNLAVANAYQELSAERRKRRDLYAELRARAQRMKAYIKAQYGLSSAIYGIVKGAVV